MPELKKTDCISVLNATTQLGITRNTMNSYMAAFGVEKHKFPFDNRMYMTRQDFGKLKQFVEENKIK